ncbi:Uncharacterised protein [Yersinia thracica]|uniref:Uncharacterized protein n=1 Tax=Yersinia thracica TaxID=2890319 RepID=A0A0T9QKQ2_9GAMM|nr:Uncharacterised protein [Yersinia thracica]
MIFKPSTDIKSYAIKNASFENTAPDIKHLAFGYFQFYRVKVINSEFIFFYQLKRIFFTIANFGVIEHNTIWRII